MKYWDASGIIPLLVEEKSTARFESLIEQDPQIMTWWATKIECASALNRLFREEALSSRGLASALSDLEWLASGWVEIQATERLRRRAIRLLRVHPLRAADSLQLAASLIASSENPQSLPFVCYDERLIAAAEKEGFLVLS